MEKTPQNDRERIEQLLARQQELERALADTRRVLAETIERQRQEVDRLDMRLGQVQARASQANQDVQKILNSRIWKVLVAGGGKLLDLQRKLTSSGAAPRGADPLFKIVCEDPADVSPRSGNIDIRGWALATLGIERVEIATSSGVTLEARTGLYRPDLAIAFPKAANAGRSGFAAALDTGLLADGHHVLTLRAWDKAGRVVETQAALRVDHVHGHANDYSRWIAEFETRDPDLIRLRLASFRAKPLISVLVPVYRTAPEVLRKTIGSVLAQSYDAWELCLVDDCSQSPALDAVLSEFAARDPRIRVQQLPANRGISGASNAALEMARGEWIALLDHDDQLAPDALFHMVEAIDRDPEADLLYSDEDHLDEYGTRSDPFFKPDWSPNLILAENYICHFLVFRRELARAAGGFQSDTDVSQDHDILLRMSAKARKIAHIARILYHWRTNLAESNRASENRERVLASSRRAVEKYLAAAGIEARVEPGRVPERWRVRYPIPAGQRVSIIIPSAGRIDMLRRNLDTLAGLTAYRDYEIVVADNSHSGELEAWVRGWNQNGRTARWFDWRNKPFNYSEINNAAVRSCDTPLVLFLNDDTAPIDAGWLEAMVEHAVRPEVGAVGARLLYPDGTIQHAGVVMGIFGTCGHAFKGAFGDQRTYFDFPDVVRDVSALTAACLMMRREVFDRAGGFDPIQFPVAYNDIDLTLSIGKLGYQIVYTPHASLYHFEASSKSPEDLDPRPAETAALRRKWKDVIDRDPFYNPNLSLTAENYSLRRKT